MRETLTKHTPGLLLALLVTCAILAARTILQRPPSLLLATTTSTKRADRANLSHTLSFVLWDTETTAWEGSNERGWSGFVPGARGRRNTCGFASIH